MLIDGFTIAAQIINFLILVLLLRRFLYKPIVQAMSDRQAKIAAQIREAQEMEKQAQTEAAQYRQLRAELDEQREALLSEARAQAEDLHQELMNAARREVEEARVSWQKGVAAERENFVRALRQRMGEQVCDAARKVLADIADAELERQALRVFASRLEQVTEKERSALVESYGASGNRIRIRSAFPIESDDRQLLISVVAQTLAPDLKVEFEVQPDLLCGVELGVQKYALGWSVAHALDALEESVLHMIEDKAGQPHE